MDEHGRSQLYQKAGYILSAYQKDLMLPDGFFEECEKKSSVSKTYLAEDRRGYVLHPRWKLYAPADLKGLVNKQGKRQHGGHAGRAAERGHRHPAETDVRAYVDGKPVKSYVKE